MIKIACSPAETRAYLITSILCFILSLRYFGKESNYNQVSRRQDRSYYWNRISHCFWLESTVSLAQWNSIPAREYRLTRLRRKDLIYKTNSSTEPRNHLPIHSMPFYSCFLAANLFLPFYSCFLAANLLKSIQFPSRVSLCRFRWAFYFPIPSISVFLFPFLFQGKCCNPKGQGNSWKFDFSSPVSQFEFPSFLGQLSESDTRNPFC